MNQLDSGFTEQLISDQFHVVNRSRESNIYPLTRTQTDITIVDDRRWGRSYESDKQEPTTTYYRLSYIRAPIHPAQS